MGDDKKIGVAEGIKIGFGMFIILPILLIGGAFLIVIALLIFGAMVK